MKTAWIKKHDDGEVVVYAREDSWLSYVLGPVGLCNFHPSIKLERGGKAQPVRIIIEPTDPND